MMRWLISVTVYALLTCGALAQGGMMPGPGTPHSSGATFAGAGDVVSGASWWGSCARVYTAAQASTSTSLCDLKDKTTGTVAICTLRGTSSGFVDLAGSYCTGSTTPSAACAAAAGGSCVISKMYDQSGGGHDVTQAAVAHMPALVFSSLGSLPCVQATSAADSFMKSATFTVANPMTVYGVIQRTANFTTWQILLSDVAGDWFGGWAPSANEFRINSGSQIDTIAPTVSDGAYHASGWIYGATSFLAVDGTTSASMGSSGTTPLTGGIAFGDYTGGGGFPSDALVCEMGIWPIAATTTNTSNMSTNQHGSANGYNF